MWTMSALDGRRTGLFDLRLTVPAKAVWARLAGAAVAISSLGLVVALLPGAATARLAASTAGTGPTVPVVACASSYGAAPPTGLPVFPHTIRPGLPAHVAKMLAYYTNNQRTLAPVLGPRGWDCQVQVGADGTTGLDWAALARPRQTVVIYMGLGALDEICTQLAAHGMSADMPAAVIEKGTTLDQRVITGCLRDLPARVAAGGLESPCLIIVGEVVRLRESLAWFGPAQGIVGEELAFSA